MDNIRLIDHPVAVHLQKIYDNNVSEFLMADT